MGYKSPQQILMVLQASSLTTVVDSTTYYFNLFDAGMDTSETVYPMSTPIAGRITGLEINFAYSGAVTNENMELYIRINGTDHTVTTTLPLINPSPTHYSNFSLNIPITRGQSFNIKMVTPAWVTNPTSMRIAGFVILEGE